jgi:hypothetical protein
LNERRRVAGAASAKIQPDTEIGDLDGGGLFDRAPGTFANALKNRGRDDLDDHPKSAHRQ